MGAAQAGHVHVLNWLKDKNCIDAQNNCVQCAAQKGKTDAVHWFIQNGCRISLFTIASAVESSNIDTLEILRSAGCEWNKYIFTIAVKFAQNTDILEWLRLKECPWESAAFHEAARREDITLLQWLTDNGCPRDEITFTVAAMSNHTTRVLEWLKINNFECSADVSLSAAMSGNVITLRWLQQNGYQYNEDKCTSALHVAMIKAKKLAIQKESNFKALRSIRRR
jgi:hypothetical protein